MPHESNPLDHALVFSFERSLASEGLAADTIRIFAIGARHLLCWLLPNDIELRSVDDKILRCFRDHRCSCPSSSAWPARYKAGAKPGRKIVKGAVRFVRFLENAGLVSHPGELSFGCDLVRQFHDRLSDDGYSPHTRASMTAASKHLVVWLHASRVSIQDVCADVLEAFFCHDCLCPMNSLPAPRDRVSDYYALGVRHFVNFLIASGHVSDASSFLKPDPLEKYSDFGHWLLSRRDITKKTCREYLRWASLLVPLLPPDPCQYDAASIRKALFSCASGYSSATVRLIVASFRFYLRYLVARGQCELRLVEAIPSVRDCSQSRLPRYISKAAVESLIDSCDLSTPQGIRDRSILLLLARLGLRAGDIAQMKLDHIDWKGARILFSGKSFSEQWLSLPQDAGDALLHYLESARPPVDCDKVYLRMRAPFTGFRCSQTVGEIVRNAIKRAGVDSPGCEGAYVLRHSFATNKLRDGVRFDFISAMLRHCSLDTTMTYARVDIAGLRCVVQPWPGEPQ